MCQFQIHRSLCFDKCVLLYTLQTVMIQQVPLCGPLPLPRGPAMFDLLSNTVVVLFLVSHK